MKPEKSSSTSDKPPRATSPLPEEEEHPILFFDGVCGLCDRFLSFVLNHDTRKQFLFAPLQGEAAIQYLDEADREQLDSVIYYDRGKTFRHSTAVVRILCRLGGIWRICGWLLWLIPVPLRNLGYRLVSRARYQFFGKITCRIPTPEETDRILY